MRATTRNASDTLQDQTHLILLSEGYRLVDDAWDRLDRRIYLNDEDADKDWVRALAKLLRRLGWELDPNKLRTLRHIVTGHEIELETGGPETSGHFLYHMKGE